MKKALLLAASFLLIISLLSGCSDNTVETDVTTADNFSDNDATPASQSYDAETLADLIYSNVSFDDMMTKVPSSSAIKQYCLPSDYEGDCSIYVSTGATPEELAVFEICDSCSADDIMEAANARLEKQADSYSSYAPEEVPKLTSAVVYAGGGYVIVCVSADNDTAAKFIKDYV